MTIRGIFLLSVVFGLATWGVVGWLEIWPRLRGRPRNAALRPILLLHSFRYVGLAFAVPGVVSAGLPQGFALPAAYGDLATATLALVSLATLRYRAGLVLVWIFNVVGTVDLVNAFYQGGRLGVPEAAGLQGAAYFIPTVYVPLLLVTHAMVFWLLLRRTYAVTASVTGV